MTNNERKEKITAVGYAVLGEEKNGERGICSNDDGWQIYQTQEEAEGRCEWANTHSQAAIEGEVHYNSVPVEIIELADKRPLYNLQTYSGADGRSQIYTLHFNSMDTLAEYGPQTPRKEMDKQTIGRDTFPVGRYRVTITVVDGVISTMWEPHLPKKLSKKELAQYRKGRDQFIRRIAPGQDVLVVEL